MMSASVHFHDYHPALSDFRSEVLAGLSLPAKQIAPKFFYDRRGSQLFDAITELPEYYPTRSEMAILRQHGDTIAGLLGHNCLLFELGSGSSRKIRILLDALRPAAYMPVDISREHLLGSAQTLARDYPQIEVHAACADYSVDFSLPYCPEHLPRAAFFPGSSIGNFDPSDAIELLRRVAMQLGEGGRLLIGVDLKKDSARLNAAYNDAQQVTAAFNLNLLERINRELGADFDLKAFRHHAFYDEERGRVEMHLLSQKVQQVYVAGQPFEFDKNETIHTENSYKYSVDEFRAMAEAAGFETDRVWTDEQRLFSVHCLRVCQASN